MTCPCPDCCEQRELDHHPTKEQADIAAGARWIRSRARSRVVQCPYCSLWLRVSV